MKPRIPVRGPRRLRPVDLSFTKKQTFWMYQFPNIVQSTVTPLPGLWLPSFASSMGMSSTAGSVSLALLSLASCGGYLLQGRLVDRYHVSWTIILTTLGATAAVFVLWGCTSHEATLYIFSILFGLFGVGYPGHWTGCASDMRSSSPNLNTGLVISLLCAGKGVGSVAAGPISEKLLSMERWHARPAYGSAYGSMIVFTGVCVFLGGAGALPRLLSTFRTGSQVLSLQRSEHWFRGFGSSA
jgi:MFS family permease